MLSKLEENQKYGTPNRSRTSVMIFSTVSLTALETDVSAISLQARDRGKGLPQMNLHTVILKISELEEESDHSLQNYAH